jgi:hypothetical protein
MKEVTAAELRQAMGKVAKRLERTGEPVHDAAARRRELMAEILADRVRPHEDVDDALRAVRER